MQGLKNRIAKLAKNFAPDDDKAGFEVCCPSKGPNGECIWTCTFYHILRGETSTYSYEERDSEKIKQYFTGPAWGEP